MSNNRNSTKQSRGPGVPCAARAPRNGRLKLLLLHPPKIYQVWAGVPRIFNDRFAYLFPPLAVMSLSSYLKQHTDHDIQVLDAIVDDLSFDEMEQQIGRVQPDVVGISASASHTIYNVALAIQATRRVCPDAFIVLGGPHVNSFPEEAARLQGVDAAIHGDGEQPLVKLLEILAEGGDLAEVPGIVIKRPDGSILRGEPAPPVHDLDTLPFPDRESCPPGKYFTPGMKGGLATTMMSSRGCPHNCVFCNVPKKFRQRSPEHVVDEIEECVNRYGIQDIHFVDDLFNSSARRVMNIAEEILRRDLKIWWGYKASIRQTNREMIKLAKRAGCYRMHYGVETYTNEGLRALNKKVTVDEIKDVFRMTMEEGVKAIAYMIIANPHEKTAEDILGVTRFIHELNPSYVVFSLFTPYPDAPIFDEGVERGLWEADCWETFMLNPTEEFDLPTAWEEHLSKDELIKIFKTVHRKFYLHPRTLLKTFATLRTGSELKRILLGGYQLLRMELLRAGQRQI